MRGFALQFRADRRIKNARKAGSYRQGDNEMTKIAKDKVEAFYRGAKDFDAGRRTCPFKVAHKVEAWVEGWKCAQFQYFIRRA